MIQIQYPFDFHNSPKIQFGILRGNITARKTKHN